MSMHNRVQPHRATRPCRLCKRLTPALVKGQMQHSPICEACSAELESQWKRATIQRAKQASNA